MTLTTTKIMRSTIKDVANLAGVTPGTASLALNRDPRELKITLETIDRVKMAAKKLHYKPNLHAKRLADGVDSHPTITVMTPLSQGFGGLHNHEVLEGIIGTASRLGINVNVRNTVFSGDYKPLVQSIGSPSLIDGIILHTWLNITADILEELVSLDRPFVLANHYVDNPLIPCIGGDMFRAGDLIAQHMLSLGHRRIAAVLGPANVCKVTSYLAGIKHAMAAYGLELPDSHWQFGSYDVLDRQGLSTLMKTHPSVSALICMNDNLALAAIGALTEMGFSVPRDISVSGFGNASFSALMHPQLTTQDEKGAIIGTQAMELLMSMMDNKTTNPKVNLAFDLIVRETTAPPSRGD